MLVWRYLLLLYLLFQESLELEIGGPKVQGRRSVLQNFGAIAGSLLLGDHPTIANAVETSKDLNFDTYRVIPDASPSLSPKIEAINVSRCLRPAFFCEISHFFTINLCLCFFSFMTEIDLLKADFSNKRRGCMVRRASQLGQRSQFAGRHSPSNLCIAIEKRVENSCWIGTSSSQVPAYSR